MKNKLFASVLVGASLAAFTACKSNIDLEDMDKTVGAEMALALPVGEISAKIGDFLGYGSISDYIQVNDSGVLFFQDTFKISRTYTKIDLSDYVVDTREDFELLPQTSPVAVTLEAGKTEVREFKLQLDFDGLNKGGAERVDSVLVRNAKFTSNFFVDGVNLPFSDIDKVEIRLDEKNFSRPKGNLVKVFDKATSGVGYNKDIPINVDEFTLSLVENKTKPVGDDNVTNEVTVTFVFTITPSKTVTIQPGAFISYNMKLSVLEYHAIWGMFTPSSDMQDADTVVIADHLPIWKDFLNTRLPFAEPEIQLFVSHSIAGPLMMKGDYLFAESTTNGTKVNATFDGKTSLDWSLSHVLSTKAPLTEMVTNKYVFDHSEAHGNIDTLFSIFPDVLAYGFHIVPELERFKTDAALKGEPYQYRASENTDIYVDAVMHMPFIFNDSVALSYEDEISGVVIDSIALDSLVQGVDFEAANVKLIFTAKNKIPFNIEAQFTFLGAENDTLDFAVLNDSTNTLKIAGPKRDKVENGIVVEAEESTFIININKEDVAKLPSISKIAYKATLGDNSCKVSLLDKSDLKLRIAIAADVKASTNLDGLFGSEGEQ